MLPFSSKTYYQQYRNLEVTQMIHWWVDQQDIELTTHNIFRPVYNRRIIMEDYRGSVVNQVERVHFYCVIHFPWNFTTAVLFAFFSRNVTDPTVRHNLTLCFRECIFKKSHTTLIFEATQLTRHRSGPAILLAKRGSGCLDTL